MRDRWTAEEAWRWYEAQPWMVGANYVPSSAVNQLEMFQAETWDAEGNEPELRWAAGLGLNVVRVFLHDLLWGQTGFLERLDYFLGIAAGCGIRVMPVLLDSCWDPRPRAGRQREPIAGVHNSRWVQAPGAARLSDRGCVEELREYVGGVVRRFRDDARIVAWDVWNEPDNGWGVYAEQEPRDKLARVQELLAEAFAWVREAGATQPLTSGLWAGDFVAPTAIQRIQLEGSDVVSFHNYEPGASFAARVESLRGYGRPVMCTEYMARNLGSTFAEILPVAKAAGVAAIHWGLVAGRTQTWLPWDSWVRPYVDRKPEVWCHDVLHGDGTPYRAGEELLLRTLLG